MTKIVLSCTISVGLALLANYHAIGIILENATALGLAYPAARSYNT